MIMTIIEGDQAYNDSNNKTNDQERFSVNTTDDYVSWIGRTAIVSSQSRVMKFSYAKL